MEQQICKAMFDKETYDQYFPNLKPEDFNKGKQSPFWHIITVVRDYYDHNDTQLSLEACKMAHRAKLQGASESERERILSAYEEVEETTVGDDIKFIFSSFKQTNLVFDIQQSLDDEDYDKWEELTQELLDLQAGKGEEEDLFTSMSLKEVVEKDDGGGMDWFLPQMQEFTPRLTRGTGTLVVARSNCGKTSLLAPQSVHLLDKSFKGIHFALSEDGEEELLVRYIQAAYNVPEEEVMANIDEWDERFQHDYGQQFRVVNTGTMHISEIEKRVKSFKPDYAIIDQYQKVMTKVNQSANTAEQRTKSAEAIKDLAKKYDFHYLCATQADKDAGWVVTDLNIDNAKTGVVGDFKTIIGLGKQDDDRYRMIPMKGVNKRALHRNINIAKNKGKMGSFDTYLFPETCEWRK